MKITTFDPIIVSPKAEEIISVFEELGFEKAHAPVTTVDGKSYQSIRMKHAGGYHVDVSDVKSIPEDKMYIRINVDNFEEAYNILLSHGFTNPRGDKTIDTDHSKAATLVSPSGFKIALVQHIK